MTTKAIKHWGKRIILFPLLALLFSIPAGAQWQNLFLNITNFRDICTFNLNETVTLAPKLGSGCQYGDIYRKKVSQNTALFIEQNRAYLYLRYPYKIKNSSQLFLFHTRLNSINGNNNKDRTAVNGTIIGNGFDQLLMWSGTSGADLIGFRGRYASFQNKSEISIKTYPVSTDYNLNKFFLNWLQPTFGENIDVDIPTRLIEIGVWGSTPVRNHNRLRLLVNHLQFNSMFQFNYTNTSNSISLNGNRRLDLPVSIRQNQISLTLLRPDKSLNQFDITLLRTTLQYSTDNHPPAFTDFVSLGEGAFSHHGISASLDYISGRHQFNGGLSASTYSGDFSINTPVLGLYLGILPIAHEAEGNISKSYSLSQKIVWSGHYKIRETAMTLALDYIHARYYFNVNGEAQLEFGLFSAPIDYPIQLDANIFDINGHIRQRFQRFSLIYSIRQIIPLIKRVDDSPIRFIEKIPDRRVHHYGGQTHTINIEYLFN
ncbi:MAG: hypothetical protein KAU06_04110 [Candidatus Marinimicrobia bacterium]|nr:hypothetical protein [Candidatus Neomarinimicrobiota bacterium]